MSLFQSLANLGNPTGVVSARGGNVPGSSVGASSNSPISGQGMIAVKAPRTGSATAVSPS